MASSSDGDFSEPPRGPNPPANMIAGQGQSTPFKPNFINFLGDTNVPSRGLTPDMLSRIDATNGPPPGSMPPPAAGGAGAGASPAFQDPKRQQLAALMMRLQQSPERGYGIPPGGGSGHGGGGGMGGGWGGK